MISPRGPIEPGRASQTPEIGPPADRADGNGESPESRMPRGAIDAEGSSNGAFGLRWTAEGRKTGRPRGRPAPPAMEAATGHIVIDDGYEYDPVLTSVLSHLRDNYHIEHATIQCEPDAFEESNRGPV